MTARATPLAAPLLFEASLAQGRCFTLDNEGEARLILAVPEQFARVLSDNITRLRDCAFVVRIEGLAPEAPMSRKTHHTARR